MNAFFEWILVMLIFLLIAAIILSGGGILSPEYWSLFYNG